MVPALCHDQETCGWSSDPKESLAILPGTTPPMVHRNPVWAPEVERLATVLQALHARSPCPGHLASSIPGEGPLRTPPNGDQAMGTESLANSRSTCDQPLRACHRSVSRLLQSTLRLLEY